MKVCLVSSEPTSRGEVGCSLRNLAPLLARRHEVTLVEAGGSEDGRLPGAVPPGVRRVFAEPGSNPDLRQLSFSCDAHRDSAAVLEAIERAYGRSGPDYLEVADRYASGLIPLQAREAGSATLERTLIGVRLASTTELIGANDGTLEEPGARMVSALEREQLRLADRLLWSGGDTLGLYRRYYSDLTLPEAVRIRLAFDRPQAAPVPERRPVDRSLRILFVGRLQRSKGIFDLVEACLGLARDDWRLTMIGPDTDTAPGGESARMTIEAMCGEDPRIEIEGPVPHDELQRRWPEHDLLVVPSTLEVRGEVALEAMRGGLPVLATPVGDLVEVVAPDLTGWHADGIGPDPIRRALDRLLADRGEVERVRSSGAIYERFLALTDPEEILAGYQRLLDGPVSAQARSRYDDDDPPLVTGIVPYFGAAAYVTDAVESLLDQTHPNLEVMIVNDGSFDEEDAVLDRLASDPRVEVVAQLNAGDSAARNLGAALARGEFLMFLDADNVLERDFVARALATMRRDPELAYVTCWLRFVAPDGSELERRGFAPIGNRVLADDSNDVNWDGDAIALVPRRLFSELGYRYEPTSAMQPDWEFYRCLREDGRFGAVIPQRLARYRVRPDSVTASPGPEFRRRSWVEVRSRRRKRAIRWIGQA